MTVNQWKMKGVTVDPLPPLQSGWVKWSIDSYRAALKDKFEFNCRYFNKINGTDDHCTVGWLQSSPIGYVDALPLDSIYLQSLLPKKIKSHKSNSASWMKLLCKSRLCCVAAISSWALEDKLAWSLVSLQLPGSVCVHVCFTGCWILVHSPRRMLTITCVSESHHIFCTSQYYKTT